MNYNSAKLEIWKTDENMMVPDEGMAAFVSSLEGKRDIALDLGAHVGTRSIWLATDGGFKKVYAVEMQIENFVLLTRNIVRNQLMDSVIPILAAISVYHELKQVCAGPTNKGQFSIAYCDGDNPDIAKIPGLMATTSLRGLIKMLGEIDFLKMDVEGSEYELFANRLTRERIANSVRSIFLERHGPNKHYFSDEFFTFNGYDPQDPQKQLYKHLEACGFVNISETKSGQIIARNSNFDVEDESCLGQKITACQTA